MERFVDPIAILILVHVIQTSDDFICTESIYIVYNSTASCLCNDTSNNAVRTVCSGPSTAPCICSAESCTVSIQLLYCT